MTTEKDDNLAIKYLELSLSGSFNLGFVHYNLGYIYETKLKNIKDTNSENKMINHYIKAIELNVHKACNQLGCYFMHTERTFKINNKYLTIEELLIIAGNNNIVQGFNNLINLYKNDYQKKIVILEKKYNLTKNVIDLMTFMLEMLNNGDYKRYCIWYKDYTGNNNMNMTSFLRRSPLHINMECPVCLETKDCLKMQCTHDLCNQCVYDIFCSNLDAKSL